MDKSSVVRYIIGMIDDNIVGHKMLKRSVAMYLQKEFALTGEAFLSLVGSETAEETLDSYSPNIIFAIACALTDVVHKNKNNLNNYFTPQEIAEYSVWKNTSSVKPSIFPIRIPNTIKICDDQWITRMDTQALFKLYQYDVINYNPETQRPMIRKGKRMVFDVRLSAVESIMESMRNGSYIPDELTFNINLDTSDESFVYDEESMVLTLKNGGFDVIDGYHRFRAIVSLMMENPDFEMFFPIKIVTFSTDGASSYIAQRDKQRPLVKAFANAMDTSSTAFAIFKRLNTRGGGALQHKIGNGDNFFFNQLFFINALEGAKVERRKEIEDRIDNLVWKLLDDGILNYNKPATRGSVVAVALYGLNPEYTEDLAIKIIQQEETENSHSVAVKWVIKRVRSKMNEELGKETGI